MKKLEVANIEFEGDALLWHQWENKRRPITLWEGMELLILKQFQSTEAGCLHEQFLVVKQEERCCNRHLFIKVIGSLDDFSNK